MIKLSEAHGNEGLVVIGISDEGKDVLDPFVKKFRISYPVLSSEETFKKFDVNAYPTNVIIGRDGKVAVLDPDDFEKAVAPLLAAGAPAKASPAGDGGVAAIDSREPAMADIARADALRDEGDLIGARDAYADLVARSPASSDVAREAAERKKALEALPEAKTVLALEAARAEALAAVRSGDRTRAAKLFRECAQKAPGTKFAAWCEARAQEQDAKK